MYNSTQLLIHKYHHLSLLSVVFNRINVFGRVFTVFSTSKDHGQGRKAMAGCILVDVDKIQVINRSPAYKNKYIHHRTSVGCELTDDQVSSPSPFSSSTVHACTRMRIDVLVVGLYIHTTEWLLSGCIIK